MYLFMYQYFLAISNLAEKGLSYKNDFSVTLYIHTYFLEFFVA